METLLNGTDKFQIDKEMFCVEERRETMPTAGLNCSGCLKLVFYVLIFYLIYLHIQYKYICRYTPIYIHACIMWYTCIYSTFLFIKDGVLCQGLRMMI